jgi:hypothetical protein
MCRCGATVQVNCKLRKPVKVGALLRVVSKVGLIFDCVGPIGSSIVANKFYCFFCNQIQKRERRKVFITATLLEGEIKDQSNKG